MIVVKTENLEQQSMLARDEMTLHNFGHFFQRIDYLGVAVGLGKCYAHEGTNLKAKGLRLDQQTRSGNDPTALQFLDSLVYSCS